MLGGWRPTDICWLISATIAILAVKDDPALALLSLLQPHAPAARQPSRSARPPGMPLRDYVAAKPHLKKGMPLCLGTNATAVKVLSGYKRIVRGFAVYDGTRNG